MWKISIFKSISQQHIDMLNQRHCITISKANRRHNEENTAAPRLFSNAGRSFPHLQCQWHEIGSSWWRQLSQRTKSTESSWCSFLSIKRSTVPGNNGAVLNIAHIIKHVMTPTTEAELAALYIMAREAVYMRIILKEMGHKEPPTPLQIDNAMAKAVVNSKVQPKKQRRWICVFVSCKTKNARKNSEFIGDQEKWTLWTIGQSIMPQHIIGMCERNF